MQTVLMPRVARAGQVQPSASAPVIAHPNPFAPLSSDSDDEEECESTPTHAPAPTHAADAGGEAVASECSAVEGGEHAHERDGRPQAHLAVVAAGGHDVARHAHRVHRGRMVQLAPHRRGPVGGPQDHAPVAGRARAHGLAQRDVEALIADLSANAFAGLPDESDSPDRAETRAGGAGGRRAARLLLGG